MVRTYTGEHGVTTVRLGDVVDQLHDQYGLADAWPKNEGSKMIS